MPQDRHHRRSGAVLAVFAGLSFYRSRHLQEPVVLGPGVTRVVKTLGDYFAPLKGTVNDANVYILEGREARRDGPRPRRLASRGAGRRAWPPGSWPRTPCSSQGRLFVVLTRPTGAPRR